MSPQTGQLQKVITRPDKEVMRVLWRSTSKMAWPTTTEECQATAEGEKTQYDPNRDIILHVDEGPAETAIATAQKYTMESVGHPVRRSVNHSSRSRSTAKRSNGKADGKTLATTAVVKNNKTH